MRKRIGKILAGICCFTMLCGMLACGKTTEGSNEVTPEATATAAPTEEPTATPEPTPEPTATPVPTATPEPVHEPAKLEDSSYPREYGKFNKDYAGRVVEINYTTYAYADNGEEITKHAYVCLPPKYDETKQYNVLYLMHGIGGNEREWGINGVFDEIRCAMDNLMYYGEAEPFIIVVPNGRSCVNYTNTSFDNAYSFYEFGKELRNDLIPYIDANFATYAEYDENGYDLTAARDHRAMAGLSMGGMQTINIGLCECLDIISYFGAFSAAPTSNTAAVIAEKLQAFEGYDINYFYNICGLSDGTALASASAAVEGLDALTDKITDGENFMWHKVPGYHDHKVWHLGLYNFAQIVFK
ncbi:MAG: alpha/beta hydrolase-fold protein [Lachnospiraceae bacterium]|nr:alpha/beta hydrolase-fold protein [Lachnospiraceae bacterium]